MIQQSRDLAALEGEYKGTFVSLQLLKMARPGCITAPVQEKF